MQLTNIPINWVKDPEDVYSWTVIKAMGYIFKRLLFLLEV